MTKFQFQTINYLNKKLYVYFTPKQYSLILCYKQISSKFKLKKT